MFISHTIYDREINIIGDSGSKNKKKSIAMIAGIIVGVLALAAIIIVIILVNRRKRTKDNESSEMQSDQQFSKTASAVDSCASFENPLNEPGPLEDPFDEDADESL